jgi:hypothetical protein
MKTLNPLRRGDRKYLNDSTLGTVVMVSTKLVEVGVSFDDGCQVWIPPQELKRIGHVKLPQWRCAPRA